MSSTTNPTAAEALQRLFGNYSQRINQALLTYLPSLNTEPHRLHAAMRYSVTVGGKRIRPILVYTTGQALGLSLAQLDRPAAAVELIHAYSLVHDDLPAMDNDTLRRGQATCHIKFDDATAILAGDALQALAYELLCHNPATPEQANQQLEMLRCLSHASGSTGMAGGQAIDLAAVGKSLSLTELETMHRCKTGALIRASVRLAVLSKPNADEGLLKKLDDYASAIGLAFQIVDDILDVTADTQTLGKKQGADQALNKPTYPALLGLDGAREHAQKMHQQALDALNGLGENFETLRTLSAYIIQRAF